MIYLLDNVVCGQLIEDVQQQPYAVILFDEVEKGLPRIWDILLKVLNGDCLTVSFVFIS